MRSLGPKRLLWVDIDGRDPDTLEHVVGLLGLSDAELKTLSSDDGRARLTRSENMLHVTLEAIETDDAVPPKFFRREMDLLVSPNIVLSVHDGRLNALRRFRDGLGGETRLGSLTAADLMSALIDEVLVGYFLLAEIVQRQIDDLDERALRGRPGDDILAAIVELRHRIGLIRRVLAPHRDAFSTLGLPEMGVAETLGRPWPGLVDRLEAAMTAIDGLRTGLLGTFDIHMGRVSQRANDVMRALTLLSAILLPSVVLAGIMGMNFKLGFFDETTNFWFVLGGMGILAATLLTVAKLRHWW